LFFVSSDPGVDRNNEQADLHQSLACTAAMSWSIEGLSRSADHKSPNARHNLRAPLEKRKARRLDISDRGGIGANENSRYRTCNNRSVVAIAAAHNDRSWGSASDDQDGEAAGKFRANTADASVPDEPG